MAAEAVPFCKTGGLADVAGELPRALLPLLPKKSKIISFLPKYAVIDAGKFKLEKSGDVLCHKDGEHWTCFTQNEKFYNRPGIYGEKGSDYPDNDERFSFYCRSALEFCKAAGFVPDIVHCHDWQTGLIPAYLKTLYAKDSFFKKTKSIFTIHNIAYQGNFPKASLEKTGLGWETYTPDKVEFYDHVSFLKAGLVYSDVVTTVSPRYAREIQTTNKFGRGMEGVLRHRPGRVKGILNGIDETNWNPANDPALDPKFSLKDKDLFEKRKAGKLKLQKEVGLAVDDKAPLVGMVTRLDPQKGFDMVAEMIPKISKSHPKVQWIVLGTGAPDIEKALEKLVVNLRGLLVFFKGFNDPLAHRIYAASDMFLMPSQFEPCGLGQMIAMKYGSIPVVTPTGGLADTVTLDKGFICPEISTPALHKTMVKALAAFKNKARWKTLMKKAMASDFSWKKSARQYAALYSKAAAVKSK